MKSPEGKAATGFIKSIDSMMFDPVAFAYILISIAPESIHRRIMAVIRQIILSMADKYETGTMNQATTDAMRLRDTIRVYGMED
jgi:hypothetical protein